MTDASGNPRISIVIPALNEAAALPDLLADLNACRDLIQEIIVADGGSTDATLAVAEKDADKVLRTARGRAKQMNLGASSASGNVLWFLHADTRVPPHAATRIIDTIRHGTAWGRFDVRLSGERFSLRMVARLMNTRSRLTGIATGDQGIFITRNLFEQIGGFPDIALMEDVALSGTLRRRSAPACLREPRLITSSRRWEQRGVLRTIMLMWRLRLAYALGTPPDQLARLYR